MTNVNGESDMTPTESETTSTVGNFSHGSRETPITSTSSMKVDRSEKARCQHPYMHVAGESDSSIVPEKPANKGGVLLPAESAEGGDPHVNVCYIQTALHDQIANRRQDAEQLVIDLVVDCLHVHLRGHLPRPYWPHVAVR